LIQRSCTMKTLDARERSWNIKILVRNKMANGHGRMQIKLDAPVPGVGGTAGRGSLGIQREVERRVLW
jgi:hypothetical protein